MGSRIETVSSCGSASRANEMHSIVSGEEIVGLAFLDSWDPSEMKQKFNRETRPSRGWSKVPAKETSRDGIDSRGETSLDTSRKDSGNFGRNSRPNAPTAKLHLFIPLSRFAAPSIAIILCSPFFVEGADSAPPSAEPVLTEVRREMLSEYRYAPPGAKAFLAPSSLHSDARPLVATPAATGADVVKMAPFEVREAGAPQSPYIPLAQTESEKTPSSVAAKLGIGTHHMDLGKVHLFATTIFYVPILVGFEW